MGTVNKTLTVGSTVSSELYVNSAQSYSSPHYKFYITATLNSQSTTGNTSNVTLKLTAIAYNDYWSGSAFTYTLAYGKTSNFGTSTTASFSGFTSAQYNANTNVTIINWENRTIDHNTDGTCVLYVNASGPNGSATNGHAPKAFNFNSSNVAMAITLPTIARASTVTSPTTYSVESTSNTNLSITVEPKASYYHQIIWKIGSSTIQTDNKTTATSSNFNVTISDSTLLNNMNKSSATLTAEVSTYGTYSSSTFSNKIGNTVSVPISITVNTNVVKPSISSVTLGKSRGWSYFVGGYTAPVVSWSGTPKRGTAATYTVTATINPSTSRVSPLTLSINNSTSAITLSTLANHSSNYTITATITITDSRGGSASLTSTSQTVYYYNGLSASLTAYRTVSQSNAIRDPAGTGGIVIYSYPSANSYTSVPNNSVSYTCTRTGSTGNVTSNSPFSLPTTSSTTITLTVKDSVNTTGITKTAYISQAVYPLDLYDNSNGSVGVGLGTTAESGKVKIGSLPLDDTSGRIVIGVSTQSTLPSSSIGVHDCRNVTITASGLNRGANFYFIGSGDTNNTRPATTETWWSLLHVKGWDDSGGGKGYTAWELAGAANDSSTSRNRPLYVRGGNKTDGWASWRQIYDSGNKSDFLKLVYPVGSIYISTSSINPGDASVFGFGTWERIGQGRVLVGVGQGTDSNSTVQNFSAEATGGEYTHTLTVNEMPSHTHAHQYHLAKTLNGGSPDAFQAYGNGGAAAKVNSYWINSAGGGQAHNNMPPYLAVYMWKRTL